jgi:hypothetical protein
MATLYHGKLERLDPGQVLSLKPQKLPSEQTAPRMEQVLEEERPAGCLSRLSAYFTADLPEQALAVQLGMHKEEDRKGNLQPEQIYVFEVEAERGTTCPMILAQMVLALLSHGKEEQARQFARLYWDSGEAWYFNEILVPSLRIVRQVELNRDRDEILKEVNEKYRADKNLALQIYRSRRG